MDKENYTLYHFTTCFFCLKVRLYMKLKGINIPKRNIFSGKQYRRELEQGGGKRQVPCLRIENKDGSIQWLYESNDIIRYINANMLPN